MKVYLLLAHADNYGRDILGVYSTKKKARKAVLALALDDQETYDRHRIEKIRIDDDDVRVEWYGPS